MAATGVGAIPTSPLRALVSPQTWLNTIHLLSDLWVGIVTFTAAITGLAVATSLLPVFLLGIPVWAATIAVSRWLGSFERGRYALTVGVRIPDPRGGAVPEGGWWQRLGRRTTAGYTWREIGYHLLLLPVGGITFALAVAIWAVPLVLLTLPVYNWALPNSGADFGWVTAGSTLATVPGALVGLALLLLAPYLVHGLVRLDTLFARTMLGPFTKRELATRVGQLEQSRARVVDSAEAERRRIERDLHDGAQQRLVALAMNLGRARARYDDDPETARALLDEAHTDAKQALTELRDLARGLHPAVLTDRGLDAALSGLAGRSPVPVTVEVDVGTRPSRTVEAIAYFVVAEALTNVARHSRASQASVEVRRLDGTLRVVVRDNGVGGASPARGSGLAGLADRVSGVDGQLSVSSPPGGPTVLTVELPCAS